MKTIKYRQTTYILYQSGETALYKIALERFYFFFLTISPTPVNQLFATASGFSPLTFTR